MREYSWFDFDQVDFVTADTHFSHARISELADRPFATVEEMDAELVRRWNDAVAPDDLVLHLGDVALGPIQESLALTAQLHGRRFLVPGNHDRVSTATQSKRAIERFQPLYEAAGWTILPEVIEGTRDGYRLLASHYPYRGDSQDVDRHTSHRPRWDDGIPLLHGHTHARDHGPDGHQFHVGADAHDYAPIPFTIIDMWIRSLPGIETRLQTAIREGRQIIDDLDSLEVPGMDVMFYVHGYAELRTVLGELLDALGSPEPD
jgi:calcineurin-like phosphoesterase family protein